MLGFIQIQIMLFLQHGIHLLKLRIYTLAFLGKYTNKENMFSISVIINAFQSMEKAMTLSLTTLLTTLFKLTTETTEISEIKVHENGCQRPKIRGNQTERWSGNKLFVLGQPLASS